MQRVDLRPDHGAAIIWLQGRLDSVTAPVLSQLVTCLLQGHFTSLILQMRDVSGVDPAGALILNYVLRAMEYVGPVYLVAVPRWVQNVLWQFDVC